jgi:hypothetical protein
MSSEEKDFAYKFTENGVLMLKILYNNNLYLINPITRQQILAPSSETILVRRMHGISNDKIPSFDDITNFREKGYCDDCKDETIYVVVRIGDNMRPHRKCLRCKKET